MNITLQQAQRIVYLYGASASTPIEAMCYAVNEVLKDVVVAAPRPQLPGSDLKAIRHLVSAVDAGTFCGGDGVTGEEAFTLETIAGILKTEFGAVVKTTEQLLSTLKANDRLSAEQQAAAEELARRAGGKP